MAMAVRLSGRKNSQNKNRILTEMEIRTIILANNAGPDWI